MEEINMLRIVIKPHPDPGAQSPETPESGRTHPDTGTSGDEQKVPNTLAGYMGPESGPFECEHCTHFQAPNVCNILTDPVDPEGCCNLFEPDPNKREEPEGGDEDQEEPTSDNQEVSEPTE